MAALIVLSGASVVSAFDQPQLDTLAYLFSVCTARGLGGRAIFGGRWLCPFGVLVIRSRFSPRLLGYCSSSPGRLYRHSVAALLLPAHRDIMLDSRHLQMAELPIIFGS